MSCCRRLPSSARQGSRLGILLVPLALMPELLSAGSWYIQERRHIPRGMPGNWRNSGL